MTTAVRRRARGLLRAELAEEIFDHFAEQGFDETTVDDAARAVGISRATFFRYFGSKEEAVIVALQSSGTDFGTVLRSLDDLGADSAWSLLRRVFEPAMLAVEARPRRMRARIRMIRAKPSLRARLAEKRIVQGEALADALAERIGDPLAARVFAVAGLAALDLALVEWAESREGSIRAILDAVFERLVGG